MNDLTQYTENDLTAVVERIRKNALNINDELAKRLAVKPGMIARFFPNQFVRQQRQISLDKDREWLLARCKIMELYVNINLQMIKQDWDTLMMTTGIGYRPELAQIIKELEMIIDESVQNFTIHIDHQLVRLKKLQAYPMFYNRAQKSAEKQIDIFMDTIEKLFSEHRNNLSSKPFDDR